MVVETNSDNGCVTVAKPDQIIVWQGTDLYAGASLCAYQCLTKRFGYTIVYCEKMNVNCFWIRNDILESYFEIKSNIFRRVLNDSLLRTNSHKLSLDANKIWHNIKC